jgi:hypothetical protein
MASNCPAIRITDVTRFSLATYFEQVEILERRADDGNGRCALKKMRAKHLSEIEREEQEP